MSLFMGEEEKEPAGEAGRALGQAGIQQKQGQRSRSFHTDHYPFPYSRPVRRLPSFLAAPFLKTGRPQPTPITPRGLNKDLYLSKASFFFFFFLTNWIWFNFRRELSDLGKVPKLSNNPPLHLHSETPGLWRLSPGLLQQPSNSPPVATPPPPILLTVTRSIFLTYSPTDAILPL